MCPNPQAPRQEQQNKNQPDLRNQQKGNKAGAQQNQRQQAQFRNEEEDMSDGSCSTKDHNAKKTGAKH